MSLKSKARYPDTITSYDVLKTVAVVLMIVDHIGFYIFPEALWWRAVGRLSAPIWLFLIGFARSRDIPPRLIIGAGILVISSIILGPAILPMTILVNMIVIRLILDWVIRKYLNERRNWPEAIVLLLFLLLPTNLLTDYGIMGLLLALIGYMVRQRYEGGEGSPFYSDRFLLSFIGGTALLYIGWAILNYDFNGMQTIFVTVGVLAVLYYLRFFVPVMSINISLVNLSGIRSLLKLGGRWTLEIYVIHIIILQLLGFYLGRESMGFLPLSLM